MASCIEKDRTYISKGFIEVLQATVKSDLSSLRWSEGFGNVVPTAILSVFLHRRYESEKRRVELTFVSASVKLFMKSSEEKSIQYARRHSWLLVATVTFLMILVGF